MGKDKIEFIKSQIFKSGFPLELEISSILRKRGYQVTNSQYFFDNDENKPREFDIDAYIINDEILPPKLYENNYWYLNPSILIECKKSSVYSWVFFKKEKGAYFFDFGHSIDVLTEKHGYVDSACIKFLRNYAREYNSFLHYFKGDTIFVSVYQQIKLRKKNKNGYNGKDAILDALSKIIKFMNYRFKHLKPFFKPDSIRKDMIFYFPVIVFDGELYVASFKETLELEESKHLVFETRYLSTLTQSMVPLYIDIVRKDAFDELISVIENDIINFNKYLLMDMSQKDFRARKLSSKNYYEYGL